MIKFLKKKSNAVIRVFFPIILLATFDLIALTMSSGGLKRIFLSFAVFSSYCYLNLQFLQYSEDNFDSISIVGSLYYVMVFNSFLVFIYCVFMNTIVNGFFWSNFFLKLGRKFLSPKTVNSKEEFNQEKFIDSIEILTFYLFLSLFSILLILFYLIFLFVSLYF